MRLLVSAFRQDCPAQANADATTALLFQLAGLGVRYELCVGSYKGRSEISVQITGFRGEAQAIELGQALIRRYKQECAFLVIDKVASTITAEGVQPIGPVIFAANQPDCDGYTQFMDGLYMYAKTYAKPTNDYSYAAPDLKAA